MNRDLEALLAFVSSFFVLLLFGAGFWFGVFMLVRALR